MESVLTLGDLWAPAGEGLAWTEALPPYETLASYLDDGKYEPLDPMWLRENYRLHQFVREAWDKVETIPFSDNWHIRVICDHLQCCLETALGAVAPGEPQIRNLLINVPPRTSKSTITSVLFPAYAWITAPEMTFLYVSYSLPLALRDSEKSRQLMQSNWYQDRWGDQWRFSSSQSVKSYYINSRLGYRVSTSVGSTATGWGGQLVIADDLHAAQEDHSDTRAEIEAAKAFWRDVIPSRSNDPSKMVKIVVGQRIAVDDVSAMLMEQTGPGAYAKLVIPMLLDEEGQEVAARSETPLGYVDPRFETGEEILQPGRFSPDVIAEYKYMERRFNAQYQQNPRAEGTSLFPQNGWQYFDDWPDPDWLDQVIISLDTRFKDERDAEASYNAMQVWGKRGPDVFLLDRYFEQSTFSGLLEDIVKMSKKWPMAYGKLVEAKANGPAIVSTLRSRVSGLILVQVGGSNLRKGGGTKYQRAEAVSWIQKAGNAWLPSPRLAPWVREYVSHMFRFPAPPNDDTDATSQAWRHLIPTPPSKDKDREAAERRRAFLEQKIHVLRTQVRAGGFMSRTGA